MVPTHRGQLLAEDFGAAVGLVRVFGNDGGLGHDDPRAGVLELCVDTDVFTLAVATAVDFGVERDLAIGNEHAGDLLLLHATCGRLTRPRKTQYKRSRWTVCVLCCCTHQQVWRVHVQRLLHLEELPALHAGLLRPLHQGFDVVLDITELPLVGRHQLPVGTECNQSKAKEKVTELARNALYPC